MALFFGFGAAEDDSFCYNWKVFCWLLWQVCMADKGYELIRNGLILMLTFVCVMLAIWYWRHNPNWQDALQAIVQSINGNNDFMQLEERLNAGMLENTGSMASAQDDAPSATSSPSVPSASSTDVLDPSVPLVTSVTDISAVDSEICNFRISDSDISQPFDMETETEITDISTTMSSSTEVISSDSLDCYNFNGPTRTYLRTMMPFTRPMVHIAEAADEGAGPQRIAQQRTPFTNAQSAQQRNKEHTKALRPSRESSRSRPMQPLQRQNSTLSKRSTSLNRTENKPPTPRWNY